MILFESVHKKTVYQWELDITKDWTINEIRNRIWMATQCNQSIPSCISVEALRMELILRGEEPIGYHEMAEDVDISNIEIENNRQQLKRKSR